MDARHLHLLRELAERGSVTAVAEATHRTASAVSQQLRTAQREAGMRLVEPQGRGIRLTEAGRLLAAGGAEVQAALAAVQARWDAYRHEPGGPVSIAAFPSAATLLFPSLLETAENAGIELRLTDLDPSEAEFAGLTADFDIVLAHSLSSPRPVGTEHLTVRELMTEPLDIAMSAGHPLAAHSILNSDDLATARWISVPQGYPFDTVLTALSAQLGQPLRITQRLRDNRLIETLVASSDHLAILPRFTTTAHAGITLRPLPQVPAQRHLSAVMRPDRAVRHAVQIMLRGLDETGEVHPEFH